MWHVLVGLCGKCHVGIYGMHQVGICGKCHVKYVACIGIYGHLVNGSPLSVDIMALCGVRDKY